MERSVDESDDWLWVDVLEETPAGIKHRRKAVRKVGYDAPMKTGDPVADRWEQQLARGEEPDW